MKTPPATKAYFGWMFDYPLERARALRRSRARKVQVEVPAETARLFTRAVQSLARAHKLRLYQANSLLIYLLALKRDGWECPKATLHRFIQGTLRPLPVALRD